MISRMMMGYILGGVLVLSAVSTVMPQTPAPPAAPPSPQAIAGADARDRLLRDMTATCHDLMEASGNLPVGLLTPNMIEGREQCRRLGINH